MCLVVSSSVVTPFQRRHVAGKLTFLRRVLGGSTSVVTTFQGNHVAGKSIYFAFALRVLILCVSVFVSFVFTFDCCVSFSYIVDFQSLGNGFVHRTSCCYVYLYVCVCCLFFFVFNVYLIYQLFINGKLRDSLSSTHDEATSFANFRIFSIYCARSVTEITPLASRRLNV